jgi:hypothetical protein
MPTVDDGIQLALLRLPRWLQPAKWLPQPARVARKSLLKTEVDSITPFRCV